MAVSLGVVGTGLSVLSAPSAQRAQGLTHWLPDEMLVERMEEKANGGNEILTVAGRRWEPKVNAK